MDTSAERVANALPERYRLGREIGRGGMAIVYLAYDTRLDRQVAIKVVRPELAASLASERFLREIRVAAKLTHSSILPLYDSGDADGTLYYVMPFVDGESLRDRLLREPLLPLDVALQLARDVAEGLAYAHSQGVIHRDVKPENILIAHGRAMISDFGIAKAVTDASGQSLTASGTALGTPPYMSPEQMSGESELSGATDLYSLGCVLYEMLAGQTPHAAPNFQAILTKRFMDPPPSARQVRSDVPPRIDDAIRSVLASAPGARPSLGAFLQALQSPFAEPVLTRRNRRSALLYVTAVSALAWGWLVFRDSGGTGILERSVLVLPIVLAFTGWRELRQTEKQAHGQRLELDASFESGLYGGLIGGGLGGTFIGLLFVGEMIHGGFRESASVWLIAQIFLVGTLSGAIFGACILLGVSWFRATTTAGRGTASTDLLGAMLGGIAGGAACGVLMALLFAMRPIPAPSAGVLYTGTALIGAAVVAGTLMYDYRGRVNALVVPFIGGAVLTVFAVALTVAFFPYAAVVQHFWYSAADRPLTAAGVSIGGMIVGAVAGLMLGTQIGGTIAIHRAWTSLRPRRG